MVKHIRWTALALAVALLAATAAWSLWPGSVTEALRRAGAVVAQGDLPAASVQVGGPFSLVDQAGRPVTDATWRGRWMLIYFGYTFCPDVCPTELQTMASALESLGAQAAQVVPIFITVDPERDTPEHLAGYVKLFDDRLVGLTGTAQQIASVARAYRVYYAKVTPKGSSAYMMDHSSFLYFMGPDGTLRALLRPGATAQELSAAIRAHLPAAG